jgi:hypothetical protein
MYTTRLMTTPTVYVAEMLVILLCVVTAVSAICDTRPLTEVRGLLFSKGMKMCDGAPATTCVRGCSYLTGSPSLLPIMCENMDIGAESPIWKCSTAYVMDTGYHLMAEITCSGTMVGTCHLDYGMKHFTSDFSWFTYLLYWFFMMVICVIWVLIGGPVIWCGGGRGSSVAFTGTH